MSNCNYPSCICFADKILRLTLFIGKVSLMFEIKHFRVVIHDRETLPLLDEHGLDIQPNTVTNVAIERVFEAHR